MLDRHTHPLVRFATTVALVLAALLTLAPMLWIVGLSLKSGADIYSGDFLPRTFHPANYLSAWNDFGMGPLFLNSAVVTALSVGLSLVLAVAAAYGFAKVPFRGAEFLFVGILLGIMIPPAALIIPLFAELNALGLYNTHIGLALVYTAFGLPVAILILRSFFVSIPAELIEAARLDGAGEPVILWRVVVPLSKAPIATVAILLFLAAWNDFFLALVLLRDAATYTLPVGIAQFIGQYSTPYELVAAAVIIAALPVVILYLALGSQFERGVAEGAVKT